MFIALEGVEGSGKSTLSKKLAQKIKNEIGKEVVLTREPGGTTIGKEIRKLLLERRDINLSSLAETFLFAADRAEHVQGIIKPALAKNNFVITDRYYYSTLAYQGYARGLELDLLKKICKLAIAGVEPDLIFLLDLPVELGLERAKSREENWTKFEEEELEFHKKVRSGFLELSKENNFIVIDASLSPEEILNEAWRSIQSHLNHD